MANSHQYLFLIILASWAVVGLGLGLDSMGPFACMQKMTPCQQYFKKLDNVPDTCCDPMKNMLSEKSDDRKCICGALSNPLVLKNLNVTQDEVMDLANACGLKVDVSKCDGKSKDTKDDASPSSSPETGKSSPSPSPAHNAATRFGKSGFAASFIAALIFSAAF
ncbi:hypothetical protein ACLB2K_028886 [Fragaria x ananassa]